MRRVLTALAALGAVLVMAVPAQAGGPPFQAGPKHGDQFTSTSADPNTGEVQIFNLNARQPSAVHCVGDGPYATLQTTQPADGVHSVSVAYKDGTWQDTVVLNVDVFGSRSGALGHGAVLGGPVRGGRPLRGLAPARLSLKGWWRAKGSVREG